MKKSAISFISTNHPSFNDPYIQQNFKITCVNDNPEKIVEYATKYRPAAIFVDTLTPSMVKKINAHNEITCEYFTSEIVVYKTGKYLEQDTFYVAAVVYLR